MTKNVLKDLGKTLHVSANVSTAFASWSPKAASSTLPDVIYFHHTGNGSYLGKSVQGFCLNKRAHLL